MKLTIHIDLTHPRVQTADGLDHVLTKLKTAVAQHRQDGADERIPSDVFVHEDDERPVASIITSTL